MATSSPKKLVFHFPVAATPTKIPVLLNVLAYSETGVMERSDLLQQALDQSMDENRFDEALVLAVQVLGLIQSEKEGRHLTPAGQLVQKKREQVQFDLLHYLLYSAWSPAQPEQHARSWVYRVTSDHLWELQSVVLDLSTRNNLMQQLDNQAREAFVEVSGFSSEKLSIGQQSREGVLTWLKNLRPEVIKPEGKEFRFNLRQVCSTELFILALSRCYEAGESVVGMDLLLSPQRRDEICKLCLLDPQYFERMLNLTLPVYPQFIVPGTRAGSYGRFIRLSRLVQVADLV